MRRRLLTAAVIGLLALLGLGSWLAVPEAQPKPGEQQPDWRRVARERLELVQRLEHRLATRRRQLRAQVALRRELEQRLDWHGWRVRTLRARVRTLQVHHMPESIWTTDWRVRQIAAAETIARESSGDPWPNCPDPYDGSGVSWDATAACENGGQWADSPGFYRCGLQFDPMWEQRFGRLCP